MTRRRVALTVMLISWLVVLALVWHGCRNYGGWKPGGRLVCTWPQLSVHRIIDGGNGWRYYDTPLPPDARSR